MKQKTKANLIIFLIIAVTAFILSSVFAMYIPIDNSNSTIFVAIENDSFEPHHINNVPTYIPPIQNNNTTNITTNFTNQSSQVNISQD